MHPRFRFFSGYVEIAGKCSRAIGSTHPSPLMNPTRPAHKSSRKAIPPLVPVVPNYRVSLPPLWSHVLPLCSRSDGSRMRIMQGSSVKVINPSVLVDMLRRRFRRGARTDRELTIAASDSTSLRAFEHSCESLLEHHTDIPPNLGSLRLRVSSESKQILECLHELAPVLTTFEIVDILRKHVFAVPNVDRVTFVNCMLNMSCKQ